MRLSRDRLRQQGLTGSGRTDEQAALRKLGTDLRVLLRMLQELNRLLQGFLRLILPGNILEGHAGLRLHVHLRTALADSHHAAGTGHSAQHHSHQDPDEDQRGKAQHDIQDQACRIIGNLLLEFHIRLIQALHDIRIRDPACIIGHLDSLARQILFLGHDGHLIGIQRY